MGKSVMEVLESCKDRPEVRRALAEIKAELEVEKQELSRQLKKIRHRRGEIGAELRMIERLMWEPMEAEAVSVQWDKEVKPPDEADLQGAGSEYAKRAAQLRTLSDVTVKEVL